MDELETLLDELEGSTIRATKYEQDQDEEDVRLARLAIREHVSRLYTEEQVRRLVRKAVRKTRGGYWPCALSDERNTPDLIADAIIREHREKRGGE